MPEARSVEMTERILRELRAPVIADDNPRAWAEAIERGATGIQTDHPGERAQFLRERGRSSR